MISKLGSLIPVDIYAYVLLFLIVVAKMFVLRFSVDFKREKEKGSELQKEVAFIKQKMKGEHPERINYYLNEYYESVGYHPEKTIAKYIASNMIYTLFIIAFIIPNKYFADKNVPFLWFSNLYEKRKLSFLGMDIYMYLILVGVGLLTFISTSIRRYFNEKYLLNSTDYKIKMSIFEIIISVVISMVLYIALNLGNPFLILISVNSVVEILFYLYMINKYKNNTVIE